MKLKISFLSWMLVLVCLGAGVPVAAQVPPSIVSPPANVTVAAGATVSLTVTAAGDTPLAYLWFKDGRRLVGVTGATLTLSNATLLNSGTYYVAVTNASGLIITRPTLVAVDQPALLGWGENMYGELGDGATTGSSANPTPLLIATNVVAAAAGAYHSLFLRADGSLWLMGWNQQGQLGSGVSGAVASTALPFRTTEGTNVLAVAAGALHSLFINGDGSLWSMGDDTYGELGDGRYNAQSALPRNTANQVVAMAAGAEHTAFLKNDGTLWTVGGNDHGQLGIGTVGGSYGTPQSIASNVVSVAAGEYDTLYITADGSLWAVGGLGAQYNNQGTIGTAAQVQTNNVVAVAVGDMHSLFTRTNGTVWVTGTNGFGQLFGSGGNGSYDFVPQSWLTNKLSVAGGQQATLFVQLDGSVMGMGENAYGQLGNGTAANPNQITSVLYATAATVVPSPNSFHALAIGALRSRIQYTNSFPRLTFFGTPSTNFLVQRSFDLQNWQSVWTTNAPTNGVIQYTDINSTPATNWFYRLLH